MIPGLHGKAQRRYDMKVEQSADYQRRVHDVSRRGTFSEWVRFGNWYRH